MEAAMRSSVKRFQSAVAVSLIFTISIAQALAEDCSFLLSSSTPALADRGLYYHLHGSAGWAKMDISAPDFSGQTVRFAYLVLENFTEPRAGVLIFKSGRLRQMDEPPVSRRTNRVQLVRLPDNFDNGACAPVPAFGEKGEKDISAKSYDDYHDQGLNVPEIKTINAFHFQYASRRGRCRRTDDDAVDSVWPSDPRSNLSQFSFDQNVVAHGTYSQVLAWFKPAQALASSENLANQRVEMKQYRTVPGRPVCVRFALTVNGRSSFLRINDLEALTQNNSRYVRSDEQEWSLSR
jgi:hypothetical protein